MEQTIIQFIFESADELKKKNPSVEDEEILITMSKSIKPLFLKELSEDNPIDYTHITTWEDGRITFCIAFPGAITSNLNVMIKYLTKEVR